MGVGDRRGVDADEAAARVGARLFERGDALDHRVLGALGHVVRVDADAALAGLDGRRGLVLESVSKVTWVGEKRGV